MEEVTEDVVEELTEEQAKEKAAALDAWVTDIKNRIDRSIIEADRRNAEYYNNTMQTGVLSLPKEYLDGEEDIEWNYKRDSFEKTQKFLYEEFVYSMSRNSIMMHTMIQSNLKKGIGGPSFRRRVWLPEPTFKTKYSIKVDIASIQAGKESRVYKEDGGEKEM
jgi:hypothetical protein